MHPTTGITRCGICCDSTRPGSPLGLGEVLLKRLYQSLVQRVVCLVLGSARVENRHSLPKTGAHQTGPRPLPVFTPVRNTGPKKVLAVLLDRVQDTLVGAEVDPAMCMPRPGTC